MASIGKDPNGRKRILFVAEDGSRKTIRLGKASIKQALAFKVKLESVIAGQYAGIDDETARWIAALPDDVHQKLATVGLVEPRASRMLGEFLEQYINGRHDVKPSTRLVYTRTQKHLIEFFGLDKPLRDIHEGDGDLWRLHLIKAGLAENTVRRTCGIARQFFTAARRRKFTDNNPFEDLKTAVQGNKAREYFLSREDAQQILEACPDAQWRIIFALARYGALRTPSETLLLKWTDIDWAKGRMLVTSPKTEHHEGGESRQVPVFPELYPYLRQAFEEAEPGTVHVVTRYRKKGLNLRTQLLRIIAQAGLKPWPKLFQNLRATRETELTERWPEHVVVAWCGNSRLVARRHYLQITEKHFEQAAQNPAQYPAVGGSSEQEATPQESPKNADLHKNTPQYETVLRGQMGGIAPSAYPRPSTPGTAADQSMV